VTKTQRLLGAAVFAALAPTASAQLIDDIEARTDLGVTEIRLHFDMPVRYVKHFPKDRGELVKLYLQALTLEGVEEIDRTAYKRIPAAPQVPPFKVLYTTVRSCFAVRDPICLDIQFNQPVRYTIRQGDDGRSILLHILTDVGNEPAPAAKPGQ
jgi:hypothetical protein